MSETQPARGTSRAARSRMIKVTVGAAVMVALAGGPGLPSSPAGAVAVAAAPPPVSAGSPLATWILSAQIPVQGTSALAVNPATHTVYVGGDSNAVEVINGLTGKRTGEISLPSEGLASSAAVNPSTDTVYVVAAFSNAVYAVSGKTNKVTATLADTMSPAEVAVNPSTNTVYVGNAGSDTVTVINGKTNAVTTTINITNPIDGIAVDPLADTLYVADGPAASGADGEVTVISGATNMITATVSTGPNLDAIAVNPQTDTIYTSGYLGWMSVISGTTDSVTGTVKRVATGIAVDPLTDTVYVTTDYPWPAVLAISGRTNELISGFPIGNSTAGVAVDPAAGNVYVSYIQGEDDSQAPYLGIAATCAAGVVITPGTGCARVAAAYQPVAVNFTSPSRGVLLGSDSSHDVVLLGTSDAGKHWSFLPASQRAYAGTTDRADDPDVFFNNPDDGWLYGYWHTSDGGASWQRAGPDGRATVAMAATAKTVYGAVPLGDGARGLYSRPTAGTRWTRILEVSANITGLAADGPAVWLTSPTHLWTTTGGRTWHEYPARCPGTGYHLAFVAAASPSDVAFLCTRPGGTGPADPKEVLTSANGGRTVHLAGSAPATGIPDSVAIPPGNPSVITIAAGTTLYRSANGGRTWTTLPFKGFALESLTYSSRTDGWFTFASSASSPSSTLWHTTDSGRAWHKIRP